MNTRLYPGVFLLGLFALLSFRTDDSFVSSRRSAEELPVGTVYIIVDKSDYELSVYDDQGWYATYPVVFGSKSLGDKMMEGDRRTPEGNFKILSKKPHERWNKMLLLDYPNKESWEKFKRRKSQGLVPKSARIGGGIALHGTWPHDNIVVDDFTNWTQGCVSLRNEDIDEICEYVEPGVKVEIRR